MPRSPSDVRLLFETLPTVPREGFGSWTREAKMAYFGDTGHADGDGNPIYDERVAENRGYRPTLRAPKVRMTPAQLSEMRHSGRAGKVGHGATSFTHGEWKECRVHELVLPKDPKRRIRGRPLPEVSCKRCGIRFGRLV